MNRDVINFIHHLLLATFNFTDVEKEDGDDNENVVKEGEVEEEEGEDEDEGEEREEEDGDDDDDDDDEEGEDEEGDNQKRYDFRKRKAVDRYQAPQKGRLLCGKLMFYQGICITENFPVFLTFSRPVPP